MKIMSLAVSVAGLACVCAGCAFLSRNSGYDTYEHLLRLYQEGKIDAQQLTSRQHGVAVRAEYAREHPTPVSDSSSITDTTTTTTDDKCKEKCKHQDPKHPDPHCPPPPGHH